MIEKGDIIWLKKYDAQGHEMQGAHPALVITPKIYNQASGKAIVCWITSKVHHYPFEVEIPKNLKIHGVILSDNLNTIDWVARKAEVVEKLPDEVFEDVVNKMKTLIF